MEQTAKRNRISVKKLVKWLWRSSAGARRQAVVNTFFGLVDVACQLLWVLACKHAIDIATGNSAGSIAVAGTVIATLMFIQIAARVANKWILSVAGVRVRNKMRLRVFSMLLKADWLHLQKHHTGDLTNRLEGDVSSITALITESIPATLVVMVQLVASFFLLFSSQEFVFVSKFIL